MPTTSVALEPKFSWQLGLSSGTNLGPYKAMRGYNATTERRESPSKALRDHVICVSHTANYDLCGLTGVLFAGGKAIHLRSPFGLPPPPWIHWLQLCWDRQPSNLMVSRGPFNGRTMIGVEDKPGMQLIDAYFVQLSCSHWRLSSTIDHVLPWFWILFDAIFGLHNLVSWWMAAISFILKTNDSRLP